MSFDALVSQYGLAVALLMVAVVALVTGIVAPRYVVDREIKREREIGEVFQRNNGELAQSINRLADTVLRDRQ